MPKQRGQWHLSSGRQRACQLEAQGLRAAAHVAAAVQYGSVSPAVLALGSQQGPRKRGNLSRRYMFGEKSIEAQAALAADTEKENLVPQKPNVIAIAVEMPSGLGLHTGSGLWPILMQYFEHKKHNL